MVQKSILSRYSQKPHWNRDSSITHHSNQPQFTARQSKHRPARCPHKYRNHISNRLIVAITAIRHVTKCITYAQVTDQVWSENPDVKSFWEFYHKLWETSLVQALLLTSFMRWSPTLDQQLSTTSASRGKTTPTILIKHLGHTICNHERITTLQAFILIIPELRQPFAREIGLKGRKTVTFPKPVLIFLLCRAHYSTKKDLSKLASCVWRKSAASLLPVFYYFVGGIKPLEEFRAPPMARKSSTTAFVFCRSVIFRQLSKLKTMSGGLSNTPSYARRRTWRALHVLCQQARDRPNARQFWSRPQSKGTGDLVFF